MCLITSSDWKDVGDAISITTFELECCNSFKDENTTATGKLCLMISSDWKGVGDAMSITTFGLIQNQYNECFNSSKDKNATAVGRLRGGKKSADDYFKLYLVQTVV